MHTLPTVHSYIMYTHYQWSTGTSCMLTFPSIQFYIIYTWQMVHLYIMYRLYKWSIITSCTYFTNGPFACHVHTLPMVSFYIMYALLMVHWYIIYTDFSKDPFVHQVHTLSISHLQIIHTLPMVYCTSCTYSTNGPSHIPILSQPVHHLCGSHDVHTQWSNGPFEEYLHWPLSLSQLMVPLESTYTNSEPLKQYTIYIKHSNHSSFTTFKQAHNPSVHHTQTALSHNTETLPPTQPRDFTPPPLHTHYTSWFPPLPPAHTHLTLLKHHFHSLAMLQASHH